MIYRSCLIMTSIIVFRLSLIIINNKLFDIMPTFTLCMALFKLLWL